MSVRQYIGARYVTKVYENTLDPSSAEWQASVNYEPLTMVTYNNGSYLSKKQVPASVGNPASNPTYWAQTGFYNGQISYLQAQIDAINASLSDIDDINRLVNRKFIFIGDSYGDADKMNWCSILKYILGLTENVDAFTSQQGGSGFVRDNDADGNGFLTLLQALNGTIDDKDSITDIIVLGGANDILAVANTGNIQANMQAFFDYAALTYPNAKVGIGFIGRFLGQDGTRTFAKYQDALYAYRQKAGANTKGYYIEVSDAASHGMATYMLDHVHPNNVAGELLCRCIASQITGGTASFAYHHDWTESNGFSAEFMILNNTVHFLIKDLPAITLPITLSGYGKHGNPTSIGKQQYLYFNKPLYVRTQIQANGTFYIGWIRFLYDDIAINIENNSVGPISANTITIPTSNDALCIDFDSIIIA